MSSRRNFIQQSMMAVLGLGSGSIFNIKFASCAADYSNHREINSEIRRLESAFVSPPDSARPGVYWYFMDGNMSKKGMTADLESMVNAGIGYVVFLEVNVGVPRGPVDFFSDEWLELFKHALHECERLGIKMTLGIGPGWTGSGGPWVKPRESMQHLVSAETEISGPGIKKIVLLLPSPKEPYFGEDVFTPELKKQWKDFYQDVAVVAFPTPSANREIKDIDEKAFYYRAPYTSKPGVKPFYSTKASYSELKKEVTISQSDIVDLTDQFHSDDTLNWDVPEGNWTVMRFGTRNNGAITRPAPLQGLGFECDKFDASALEDHLDAYIGKIFEVAGDLHPKAFGGLKVLHMDSWEMGAQNWSSHFREMFTERRGYDPLPFYPVYSGNVIESIETSERFLWDLRLTSQELILENHARKVKKYCDCHGLKLSIEPYDMNPTADLELGSIADIPMCEFWSKGFGFDSSYSCIEATSIAHVDSKPVVQAEAFTADGTEAWKQYPGSMKLQGDWAFAAGINRFFYHTFVHKSLDENLCPGMTMGPYGVHWDRKQTWWPMVAGYHRYVTRCQFMLQQGQSIADILYLTPEGAPQVFVPPSSALEGNEALPDRKGYNFDGCSPGQLHQAGVNNNKIIFPGGATYQILVLSALDTMTPTLLEKIRSLIEDGALVVSPPPRKSPSLSGFPESGREVRKISEELWGEFEVSKSQTVKNYGKGKIFRGEKFNIKDEDEENLYPEYEITTKLLNKRGLAKDFESPGPIRYTHRGSVEWDIYFVANKTNTSQKTKCLFRSTKGAPELWDPMTGKTRILPDFSTDNGRTIIPLKFEPCQSFFIVFGETKRSCPYSKNFPQETEIARIEGPWEVSFDRKGPRTAKFETLKDWTSRPEESIKYFSGVAVYRKIFDLNSKAGMRKDQRRYLDLGSVKNIARIRLNNHDLGVVWTSPWKIDITDVVKAQGNELEIEVANLWLNRLIGDENFLEDGITDGKWPEWMIKNEERPSNRLTFATYQPYKKNSPLLKSGLLGPVTIRWAEF